MSTFTRAFGATYLTVQAVGLCAGTLCVLLYEYPRSTITISDAPAVVTGLVVLMLFGAVVTCIPALLFAAVLTPAVGYALRRKWPTWARYFGSAGIMTCFFFALVSFTARPLPDLATHFRQEAPGVRRPALSISEAPFLMASLTAGVLSTWACNRVFRGRI